jgi:tryptophan halogenase
MVIVGGGTAGWMTAALMGKLLMGKVQIELVESDEIGIIGVGEATIPSVQDLLRFLNIDEKDFIKETNATYKLAIRFKDWSHIGGDYWHPFGEYGPLVENSALYLHWLQQRQQKSEIPSLYDISICAVAAKNNKFALPDKNGQSVRNWLNYAYHFDAGLFAEYLKGYGKAKGVNHVIGTIGEVAQDDEGKIKSLILNDGRQINGDFFFDCTGFSALLIDKTLGSNYEDWTDYLPVDTALAVPSEAVSPLNPYTLSTAREAGWTWRIPLQSRIGNGYVYSSRHTDEESAKNVLLNALDSKQIADIRKISFRAGRRKETWVKNCVALGLASGFLEPLESTAIHLVIASIFKFFEHLPQTMDYEYLRSHYNQKFITDIEEIRDFIILHYCVSKRDDSDFWKYVKGMQIPDSLRNKIEIFKQQGKVFTSQTDLFRAGSWVSVMVGMGLSQEYQLPILETIPNDFSSRIINDVANAIASEIKNAQSHDVYLSNLLKI